MITQPKKPITVLEALELQWTEGELFLGDSKITFIGTLGRGLFELGIIGSTTGKRTIVNAYGTDKIGYRPQPPSDEAVR